jgi:hypothetical protein
VLLRKARQVREKTLLQVRGVAELFAVKVETEFASWKPVAPVLFSDQAPVEETVPPAAISQYSTPAFKVIFVLGVQVAMDAVVLVAGGDVNGTLPVAKSVPNKLLRRDIL